MFKGLSHAEDLVCQPILGRDGSDINVGNVLSPHTGCLMKTVELWMEGRSSLLMLRDAVLGVVIHTV